MDVNTPNFKTICLMNIQQLTNFPYIEEDFDALTDYELLCKIVDYLNQVITNNNEQNETVTALYNAFVSLKDYVDNYFENLDVQDEINNKLEEMATNGELTTLIKGYVDPIYEEYENEINAVVETQNGRILNIENKFQNLVSGSPLIASSVSDMTDTSRIYVNTSNGYWYYYDGSEWVQGGIYQSSGIANDSLYPNILKNIKSYNLKDVYRYGVMNSYFVDGTGFNPQKVWTNNASLKSIKTRIPHNAFIRVSKNESSDRFRIAITNTVLNTGDSVDSFLYDNNSAVEFTFYNTNANFLYCTYTSSNQAQIDINVEVFSTDTLNSYIGLNNLNFLKYETVDNLFDETCKVKGKGTQPQTNEFRFVNDDNYCSYMFLLNPNETYNIEKTGGNKFRVCLWNWNPLPTTFPEVQADPYKSYLSHPSSVVIDDDTETECTFNSGNFVWCTILFDNTKNMSATFNITSTSNRRYIIPKELYDNSLEDPFTIINSADANSSIWTQWNNRLAFGMNTTTAPIPTYNEQQLLNKGTIITYNTYSQDYNRWKYHVFEAYAKDLYSRITMLLNKHDNELNRPVAELYYYTGASHKDSAYSWFRLGSDVKDHSFMFNRDTFVAYGKTDLKGVMTLARISPTNDLITTYSTVEDVDTYLDPENNSVNNAKGLLYVSLLNAEDGSMFYDTDRDKVVVKVNEQWCDMNVTPVPDGTYDF